MSTTLELLSLREDLQSHCGAVRRRMNATRLRLRLHLMASGLLWTCATAALLAAVTFGLDRWLRLERSTRLALLAAAAATLAVVGYRRLVAPLCLRVDDLDLAELLDRRQPGVGQCVANILQLPELLEAKQQASPVMVRAAVLEQAEWLGGIDLTRLFDAPRHHWRLTALAALLAIAGTCVAVWPGAMQLWARRWFAGSDVRWPQRTYMIVENLNADGRLLVPRGEPVLLQVNAQPEFTRVDDGWRLASRGEPLIVEVADRPVSAVPDQIIVSYRAPDGAKKQGNLTRFRGSEFRYELPPLAEAIDFELAGGDDWLGPIRIEPIDRPTLKSLIILAQPPGNGAPQEHRVGEADTQLLFLPQTQIELRLTSDQPLASVMLNSKPPAGVPPVTATDEVHFATQWTMHEAVTLEIHLVGRRAALESKPYFLTIGLLNDREPRVTLRSSGVGRRITPVARVPLAMRATDDFGITQLNLEMEQTAFHDEKPQASTHRIDLQKQDASGPATDVERSPTPELAEYGLEPGNVVKLRGLAMDNCVLGPHTGYSRWLTFQIVRPEELFYEILVRQREQRAKFAVAVSAAQLQVQSLEKITAAGQGASLVRRHQVIARQVWQVANHLDATLEEMTLNDLGHAQARELLQTAIITPLRKLHDQRLTQLRSQFEELAASMPLSAAQLQSARTLQAEVLAEMQRILEQMRQWESFVDVVNQLHDIIKMQSQLMEATEHLKKAKTEQLFDN